MASPSFSFTGSAIVDPIFILGEFLREERRKGMAIENPVGKRLTLKLSKGTDPESGKPIYTSVSISKIIPAADADALLATANDLAGLLL